MALNDTQTEPLSSDDSHQHRTEPRIFPWDLQKQPRIYGFATWEMDIINSVCRYSPEWTTITGYDDHTQEKPLNWTWWSGRMHVDDMACVRLMQSGIVEGKARDIELIFRFRRADGCWIRLLSRGSVVRWTDDGKPAHMSGMVLDISHLPDAALMATPLLDAPQDTPTQADILRNPLPCENTGQVQDSHRARLNERRLNALYHLSQMENASENELMHFSLSSIMQLTGSASSFLFLPHGDLFGKGRMFWSQDLHVSIKSAHLPDDELPQDFYPYMTEEDGTPISRLLRNGDGETPLLHAHEGGLPIMRQILCPVIEGGQVVCLAGICNKESDYDDSDMQQVETFLKSTWNILRRHRSLHELQRAKVAAESANKAKNEFLANISHELRTPLNGILSMLQLLEGLPMPRQQRELISTANYSGKALVRIISDILDFSRMESGKMQLVPEPFDIKTSLTSSLRLFQEEATKKKLGFSFDIDEAIPAMLTGDDARVRQIIYNLVGNALKFTERGGVSARCALEEPPREGKVRLSIHVTDTGIGIPPEKQEFIFDAFTQVDSSSTKQYRGTGLGLSIVKCLASMMGGEVKLESEVGKGTTISCTLALDVANGCLPETQKAEVPRKPARTLSILVAEDDTVGRFAIQSFLQRAGHRVVCVCDGRQALEALQLYPFDCIFTDIQMPGMDGLELAERIRANALDRITPGMKIRAMVRGVFPQAPDSVLPIDQQCIIVAVSAHTMVGDKDKFLQHGIDHYIAKPIDMVQLNTVLHHIIETLSGKSDNLHMQ